MKRKLFTLAVICTALFFTGCSDVSYVDSESVDQNSILQCYSIGYDAQTQVLSCEATFRVDNMSGSCVRLTGSSSVTCDKEEMLFASASYFWFKDSPKEPGKVIFNYVNNDGRKFVNAFKFKSIDTKSESISLTQGMANTLTFQGKKANEYDRFYLVLKRDGQEDVEVEASEADGNELTFAADDLSSLAKGTFDAQLVRRTEGTNVKAADRGGFWNAEYASVLKKVTIK
ncbi:MAG: hypothetical protein IJT61_06250 [Bacteroidales bacterium]|nr:hypothetical protein [Bacteroidales bacterium]